MTKIYERRKIFYCFSSVKPRKKTCRPGEKSAKGETIMTLFQSTTAGLDWRDEPWITLWIF